MWKSGIWEQEMRGLDTQGVAEGGTEQVNRLRCVTHSFFMCVCKLCVCVCVNHTSKTEAPVLQWVAIS